ncbi:hypothetical protein MHUMG1_09961 [Metarhizium humberi]|uniref:HpcH/HpaI aldolase/citrate lyase domain-containing protein n=1 Tax=Metarhizium humberi TaxID=2596975 RepID=A0A9P8M1S4_9HYPO|nr:hypothetical protein MHUMG1_09961 [Metarhizium humberi]
MEAFRALSLFQPSNFVAAIQSTRDSDSSRQRRLFGAMLSIPHMEAARSASVLGFEFILIDAQHTAIDAEGLVGLIRTINFTSEGKTCTLVRVPGAESHLLAYALDAGASGIVFPHINSRKDAMAAVNKVRYAYKGGERSLAPWALVPFLTDQAPDGHTAETISDEHVAVICQIETTLGLENVDEIAATPGINALMLGPGDMRVSLRLPVRGPGRKEDDAVFCEARDRLVKAAKAHQMALMTIAFRATPGIEEWLKDFDLIVTSSDINSIVRFHLDGREAIRCALRASSIA